MASAPTQESGKYAQMLRTSGGSALPVVARAVANFYEQLLAPSGLSVMQLGILRVCCHRGPVAVTDLARDLAASSTMMERCARPLVARGLLRRNSTKRKQRTMELTAEGKILLADGIARWEQAQLHLARVLGEQRWNDLRAELSAITEIAPAVSHVPQSRG
jgi:DNA-binding MarR family transcriptional regulator